MNNNKLIAEFMGYDIITEAEKDKFPTVLTTKDVKYDTSWDWLMPVVQKCFESVKDEDDFFDISGNLPYMDETYNSVVKFIKIHNDEK